MKNTVKIIKNVTTTPDYNPGAVKALMRKLKLNEKGLALLLNVSPMSVKLWTVGAVHPCGMSRRLLQLYELFPEIIDRLAEGSEEN